MLLARVGLHPANTRFANVVPHPCNGGAYPGAAGRLPRFDLASDARTGAEMTGHSAGRCRAALALSGTASLAATSADHGYADLLRVVAEAGYGQPPTAVQISTRNPSRSAT